MFFKNWRWHNTLSDCNWTRNHHHLVHKRTLNHLAKLVSWLSCVVSTYLYGAFDCMFFSCHVRVSEWIHTLQLPDFRVTLTHTWHEKNIQLTWTLFSNFPKISIISLSCAYSITGSVLVVLETKLEGLWEKYVSTQISGGVLETLEDFETSALNKFF